MAQIKGFVIKSVSPALLAFFSSRVQIAFLFVFFTLNAALFIGAVPVFHDVLDTEPLHPTYAGAADGQRYWGVAKNLLDRGTFHYELTGGVQEPLKRGGPIPSLVFAGSIGLVGFDHGPLIIVALQAFLLYLTGLLSRRLAEPFSINRNLVQGLVLFNPSLIGLAHHAQSEILFLFFFTYLLSLCVRLLDDIRPSRSVFISIGICSGLLLLTRPAGLAFVLALPLVLTVSIFLARRGVIRTARQFLRQILPASIVAALVVSPWVIHNYQEFGQSGFTHGTSRVLRLNHLYLLSAIQLPGDPPPEEQILGDLIQRANKINQDPCCIALHMQDIVDASNEVNRYQCGLLASQPDCSAIIDSLHLAGIKDKTVRGWSRALLTAWISTYVGGGIYPIASYLGLVTPDRKLLQKQAEGLARYKNYFFTAMRLFPAYFILFLVGITFSIAGRIMGIIGFTLSIRKLSLIPYHFLYLCPVAIFTATYLFIGVSRFRAHLEPILAIYAVIGIVTLLRVLQHWFSSLSQSKSQKD